MRYFKMLSSNDVGEVRWVSRLVTDEDTHRIVGQTWNGTAWIDSETVLHSLVGGDPLFERISEDEARTLVPAAFE